MTTTRLAARAVVAVALVFSLTACAPDSDQAQVRLPQNAAESSAPSELAQRMSEHSLDTMDAVEMINHLDRLGGDERPTGLMASVRPGEVVVSSGDEEKWVALPDDKFYLSIAPYVDETHDCFHHSLTTCQGELVSEVVKLKVKDRTNDVVLLNDTVTTFENGFIGIWLPRDIKGTIKVTYDGKAGEVDFTTSEDAATCLTTLRVV